MSIEELFSPADVVLDLRAPDKRSVLSQLSALIAPKLNMDAGAIYAVMAKREELGSTGMGDGVAIPHARLPEAKRPVAVFARLKQKVPFDAVDEQPVDLVCMLVLPTKARGGELNTLANVARALRNAELTTRLRKLQESGAVYRALTKADNGSQRLNEPKLS